MQRHQIIIRMGGAVLALGLIAAWATMVAWQPIVLTSYVQK